MSACVFAQSPSWAHEGWFHPVISISSCQRLLSWVPQNPVLQSHMWGDQGWGWGRSAALSLGLSGQGEGHQGAKGTWRLLPPPPFSSSPFLPLCPPPPVLRIYRAAGTDPGWGVVYRHLAKRGSHKEMLAACPCHPRRPVGQMMCPCREPGRERSSSPKCVSKCKTVAAALPAIPHAVLGLPRASLMALPPPARLQLCTVTGHKLGDG